MSNAAFNTGTEPDAPETTFIQRGVNDLLDRVGLHRTCAVLGVNRSVIVAAAGGRPIRSGSRALIVDALDRLTLATSGQPLPVTGPTDEALLKELEDRGVDTGQLPTRQRAFLMARLSLRVGIARAVSAASALRALEGDAAGPNFPELDFAILEAVERAALHAFETATATTTKEDRHDT